MKAAPIPIEDTYAAIERVAAEGRRCPESGTFNVTSTNVNLLARLGRIRVDIYFHNYRVVTIMDGEHKGKTTAPCPKEGAKPYRSIGKDGATLSYARRRISAAPVTLASTTTPWGKR